MENNKIDDLFKDKIKQIDTLPENIDWDKETGWKKYQQKYLVKKESVIKTLISHKFLKAS